MLHLLLALACRTKDLPADTGGGVDSAPTITDEDGDGFALEDDCDDTDPAIHPDAVELCDGLDNDCDGTVDVDAGDAPTWYADGDEDGHGAVDDALTACEAPDGYVDNAGDCDDTDSRFHPGADESDCTDPNDYNCDGSVAYADVDGDGWVACEECDDGDADVHPDADEVCDGIDNDCDGATDPAESLDALTWYADMDEDGYGDADVSAAACEQPAGYVLDATDCDDDSDAAYPGADETCDGVDTDCDGTLDEDDALDASTWYADSDSDTYGDAATTAVACEAPTGFVSDATDCDDTDDDAFPGADEYCDGIDTDCDGTLDEDDALDASTWYADGDSDDYGDPNTSTEACDPPTGYVSDDQDCDDTDSGLNPDTVWYADTDSDDYGDASSTTTQCEQPTGYVLDDQDCDDSDPDRNPDTIWYADSDSDDYGDPSTTTTQCEQPTGYVKNDQDCDDTEDELNPDTIWYADTDSDDYGDPASTTTQCTQPTGYVSDSTDCDDTEETINPDTEWFPDLDGDTYGAEVAFESCQDWLDAGYDTDGVYTVLPFGDETTLDVWCDMTEDDGGWTLLFHQDLNDGGLFADKSDATLYNESDPENGLYSILDYHTNFQNSTGEYELRLTWPDEGLDIQHWSQTSDLDASSVTGYTAIDVNYTGRSWGGLEKSTSAQTYLDGSVGVSNWWYAVGVDTLHDGGIPGPYSSVVDQVSLWVRKESASASTSVVQCEPPTDWVQDATDCDDSRNQTYDGATEVCDGVSNDCSDTSWTDDAGLASFQDSSGAWTDYTSTLGAGTSSSPASATLSTAGTLNVCEDTWYVNLNTTTSVEIVGVDGAKNVILDGAGAGRVLNATVAGDVVLRDLYLTGGYSANGGCINVYGPESFTFDGGYIVDCESTGTGGAIRTYQVDSVSLSDVHIDGSIASGQGGALWLYETGDLTFTDVTISDTLTDGTGGGFLISGVETMVWDGVRVTDNESTTQSGGGYVQDVTEATWTDVLFDGNTAPTSGGLFAHEMEDWILTDLEVTNTTTSGNAGGVYISTSVVEIYESEFYDNTAAGYGAGLTAYLSTVTLDEVDLYDNVASGNGGAVRSSSSDLTLIDVSIEGNDANRGGGLYITGSGYTTDVTDGLFDDNLASSSGGAVYLNSGTFESTTSDYLTNTSEDIYVNGDGAYDYGSSETFTCDTTNGCI